MTWLRKHPDLLGGLFIFLFTQVAYLLTLTVACPFWDSGEFIATSYTLGIPHPPGTPLYVLIGRLFSMLPIFPMVATRVNYLSALASGLAVTLTYLITVEIYRAWCRAGARRDPAGKDALGSAPSGSAAPPAAGEAPPRRRPEDAPGAGWVAFFAGAVAALFTAFGRTFWDNAIEAEVYALSSMIMALALWLILRWARPGGDRAKRTALFALLYYVLCLAMGIHLGTFLVLPAIVLFALLIDHRIFGARPLAACGLAALLILLHPGMLPTLGYKVWLPLVAGAGLASFLLGRVWSTPARWVLAILVVLAFTFLIRHGWLPSAGLRVWSGLVALAVLVPLFLGRSWSAAGPRGLLTWCFLAAAFGMSTHYYLWIRSHLDPSINEADPSNLTALWNVLIRDQYKPPNPFQVRQAPWGIQLTRHFWDYARDQYSLGIRPVWFGWLLPYALGVVGAIGGYLREKKTFILVAAVYLITSLGLVFYLNFKADEVRERDYFFVAAFHFFAVWIGLGVAVLLDQFRAGAAASGARAARGSLLLAGVLTLLLPVLTMKYYWHTHDRTGFYVAEDYAYNMLEPLKPNAILFTNGDNDTFPLWYIQDVEGLRRDVRVVNLSLLNTDWYLRQLRDDPPQIDLGWSNTEIEWAADFTLARAMYQAGYPTMTREKYEQYLDQTGLRKYVRDMKLPLMTKDIATARIIEREFGKRPLYLAVTVPDVMGLEDRLVMNGLVFEIEEAAPGETDRIDFETTRKNLFEVYRYRGLLDKNRKTDTSVYKDANARKLSQNYSAALVRLADEYITKGEPEQSLPVVEMAAQISPTSRRVLYSLGVLYLRAEAYDKAEQVYRRLLAAGVRDPRVYRNLGRSQEARGDYDDAEESYRRMYAAAPGDFEVLRDLFSFLWEVQRKPHQAVALLEDWLSRYPDDQRVLQAYQDYRDSLVVLENRQAAEDRP